MIRLVATGFDQLAVIAVGVLLLPIYFSILGKSSYGLWLSTGGILMWVSMANISPVVGQRVAYYYGKCRFERAVDYLWAAFLVNCVIALLLLGLTLFFARFIPVVFDVGSDVDIIGAFSVASVAVGFQMATSAAGAFINSVQLPAIILVVRPIIVVVYVATIYFGLRSGLELYAIPIGMLVREVLIGTWNSCFAVRIALKLSPRRSFNVVVLRDLILKTPAAVLGLLGRSVGGRLQYTVLGIYCGTELVSLYDASTKVLQMLTIIINRFIGAVVPSFSHLYGTGDRAKIVRAFKRFFYAVYVVACLGGIIYSIFNPTILKIWLGQGIVLPGLVCGFAALACVLCALSEFYRGSIIGIGQITYGSMVSGIAPLCQLAMLLVLIKYMHMYAIPISQIIVYLATLLLYERRIVEIMGGIRFLSNGIVAAGLFTCGLLMVVLSSFIGIRSFDISWWALNTLCLFVGIVLYLLKVRRIQI